jgi:hypothetical protein
MEAGSIDKRSLIRCSVPKCSWGYLVSNFDQLEDCYTEYMGHCVRLHGLPENATNFRVVIDSEKLLISLRTK